MDKEKPVTRAELDSGLRGLKDDLLDSMRQIETNLLTEFHRHAKGQMREYTMLKSASMI